MAAVTGTEAAQGVSIQAAVNVSDRPLTGQGVMGMRTATGSGQRLVHDASHYVGQIRRRITELNNETSKLRQEIEQITKDTAQYSQYEKKYENLIKSKDTLEGQLADYNLAMDKTRTSTDPDEVQQMAHHLNDKNRQSGQELDRVFMIRKQRESEVAALDDQLEAHYRAIQARINELEPGKLRAYNELMAKQRDYQEKCSASEHKLSEISARIRQLESDDKASSLRKEYVALEKTIQAKRRDLNTLQEELQIANMEPKEAHARFVARVNDFKTSTKNTEERIVAAKEEMERMKKNLAELNESAAKANSGVGGSDGGENGDAAKYELLQKRDQDMTAFIDKFDETRGGIIEDTNKTKATIVAVLEHIGKGLEDQHNLPSQEALGDMQDADMFKRKNFETAQRTMESLVSESKKRERELELLKSSEPKFQKELASLKEAIGKMKREIKEFADIDGLRRRYETTQDALNDLKRGYIKRRDGMRLQVQSVSSENEALKRQCSNNETFKELEDTERRLKQFERTIFEMKEFVEMKTRETNYERLKAACNKSSESLNSMNIKKSLDGIGGNPMARK